MATRSRTSFNKRQKELARLEKQRDKAARRVQRKLEKQNSPGPGGPEMGEPVSFDEDGEEIEQPSTEQQP